MKKLSLLMLLVSFLSANTAAGQPQTSSEIEVLARIQTSGSAVSLVRLTEGDVIPSVLQDKKLEKVIASLEPGTDALVKGHISYQATTIEGQTKLKPLFIIESISPVSLKMLGRVKGFSENDLASTLIHNQEKSYSPVTIPISTEVASAITLTTTVLLMQSLTANPSQSHGEHQLNTGIFLFAGALATGVFIYEQITSSK